MTSDERPSPSALPLLVDPERDPSRPLSPDDLLLDDRSTVDWIQSLLTIPNEFGEIVPFVPTPQQRLMDTDHTGRDDTVKARQTRATSWFQARNLRRMTTAFGLNTVIITQTDQMTMLFRSRIRHHLHDLARNGLKYEVGIDNKDELVLTKLENRYVFISAESKGGGARGINSAHIVHASEVAHWQTDPGQILGGLIPAIPPPPYGWFDKESTPNGADGYFYEDVQDGLDDDSLTSVHFYPWWIEPAYTIEHYRGMRGIDVDALIRSFKPTFDESRLIDQFSLSPAQILWRRVRTRELLKTGQFFAQEYPEDLNKCFLTTGSAFFNDPTADVSHLEWYADQCANPMALYDELPYHGTPIPFYGPNLRVWEPPVAGRTYVMFMDCAAGFGNSELSDDWTAMPVLDVETCRHVATLRVKCTPEQAGAMACAVGAFYNTACYAVERNGYGQGALNRARDLSYPNIFYYNDPDQPDQRAQAGWYTSEKTRDMMLTKLRLAVFNRLLTTRDAVFVRECGAFTWQKIKQRGDRMWRAEARSGKDDMVIAMGGALTVRERFAPKMPYNDPMNAAALPSSLLGSFPDSASGLITVGRHGVVTRGQTSDRPWLR